MDKNAEKINVILSAPTKSSIRKVLKKLKDRQFAWAYFGEDVTKAIAISRQVGGRGQRIEIGEKLQETARSLRQPYIDYTGRLGIKNNSLDWWASYLSEKNPFQSRVFLYSCYLKLCQVILDRHDEGDCFVFFFENPVLRKSFIKNFSDSSGYELYSIEPLGYNMLNLSRDIFSFIVQKVYFLTTTVSKILLSKYIYKPKHIPIQEDEEGYIFILTWMDSRSFNDDSFTDAYFGDLALELRKRGKKVIIVPYILGGLSAYYKSIKQISRSEEKFLVLESFLNVSDILRITLRDLTNIPRMKAYPLFEKLEISDLIFDEYKKNWIEKRTMSLLLLYEIVKRWKTALLPIDNFILTFENRIREKVICIALKEFYPTAHIIGYQHSTVSLMSLDHFFSKEESEILPFPDKLITNGEYTNKLFIESGYDHKKVVCGGAIRYSNLLKLMDAPIQKRNARKLPSILVTPSISLNEAAELIWKVYKAFRDSKGYKIIIKCHPLMPFQRVAKKLGINNLPPHFRGSNESVDDLLRESDVLIYTTSTTCIEALALGVPALHIESDFIIDMDVLDFKPSARYSATDVGSIRKTVEGIIKIDQKELTEKRKQWKMIVSEIFGPVNEHTFDLFLREI